MDKVGVSKEEQKLSYYRFYEKAMAAVPEEKLRILAKGASAVPILPLEERNLFLAGKDEQYCQMGYGVLANGMGFVCNETFMPAATPEMLDWWFPWHSVGTDLRYKIWDPEDHYFARANDARYVCDPKVPVREKTWGITHYILEDIGFGPALLVTNFKRPRDLGYDETLLGTDKCASLVCAIGEGGCPVLMTHKWYACEGGTMLKSRFWLGCKLEAGAVVPALPEGVQIPLEMVRGLFAHNIKEFSNLASILPTVYSENKDNF